MLEEYYRVNLKWATRWRPFTRCDIQPGFFIFDNLVHFQGSSAKGSVKDLEIYRKGTKDLQAGDRGGAFIKLKSELELRRGGFLYDPKSKPTVGSNNHKY